MSPESPNLNLHSWAKLLGSVKNGLRMHREAGLLTPELNKEGKRERPWRNISWHCLCVAARVEIVGEWLGFSRDLVTDMKNAAFLHDYDKRGQVELFRKLKETKEAQLQAVIDQAERSIQRLRDEGFSERVVWLASAPGGLPGELILTKGILDEQMLTDDKLAYVICHLGDDFSSGSRLVRSVTVGENGQRTNEVDYRAEENEKKKDTQKLAREREDYFIDDPFFGGLNLYAAMAKVSHLAEQRLAEEINKRTGEKVDPMEIPEIVDRKLQEKLSTKSSNPFPQGLLLQGSR